MCVFFNILAAACFSVYNPIHVCLPLSMQPHINSTYEYLLCSKSQGLYKYLFNSLN